MSSEGFLSRWSRRKVERSGGEPPVGQRTDEPPVVAPPAAVPLPAAPAADSALPAAAAAPAAAEPGATAPPKPTLADVESLTGDESFARFVARDVDPDVRNAAMKKLFSDPRYNVMDGLDTYIDDYGKPDPIPLAMLRQMTQSKALGLFDHEDEEAAAGAPPAAPPALPDTPEQGTPALSDAAAPHRETETPDDEDPDLQLQPDDGDRRAGPGPGADDGARS